MVSNVVFIQTVLVLATISFTKKINYVHIERPVVSYIDTNYLNGVNVSSRKYGRANPIYYVTFVLNLKETFGNNVSVSAVFYEAMGSAYKRSFIEFNYLFCNMFTNPFTGRLLENMLKKMKTQCPLKPGIYYFANATIIPSTIPNGFPFKKGRVYVTTNLVSDKKTIAEGHFDFELRGTELKDPKWFE